MKPPSGHPQQQTLFIAPKPTDEHRWPRGYTPDRVADVHKKLGKIAGIGMRKAESGPVKYAITGAIARSTADVSGGLPKVEILRSKGTSASSGDYTAPRLGGSGRGLLHVQHPMHPQMQDFTVMHEVGHHVDYHSDPRGYVDRGIDRQPTGAGWSASPALEGFAEGYASAHYRPDPRTQHPLNPDQMRGYDQPFGRNATYQQHFARAGGDPSTIPSVYRIPERPKPGPSQGKLF